jgi:IS605 OrfB family transposase
MLIRKAFKYQLKTTGAQKAALKSISDCNRFVWNKALALQTSRLERHEKKDRKLLTYNELACFLKLWKHSNEWFFLKDTPSQTLQQTLKDLERAIKDAFDRRQPLKKFPVFKRKHETKGFRFPQSIKVNCNEVFIPKIGWVKFRNSRKLEGELKNMTVSERCGKWYVSIQVEVEVDSKIHEHPLKNVGIDLGIKKTITLSNGEIFQGAKSYKKYKLKLAKEQRKLAKKQKFSSNWKKQKSRITKLHKKIADTRQDRNHWVSTKLTKEFGQIYSEDLKIKNMTKSSKGTIESPGKMVKQKSGLNREILDQAWYEFCRQLEYKSKWIGGMYVQVDPKYTSQRCSVKSCGHKAKENRENQAKFLCKKCGHEENADINAAKNILAAGLAVYACGGESLDSPKKQEPLAA